LLHNSIDHPTIKHYLKLLLLQRILPIFDFKHISLLIKKIEY
jgi:hypothetical protein